MNDLVVENLLLPQLLLLDDYMILVLRSILILLDIAHMDELLRVNHWHWHSLYQVWIKVRELIMLDALMLTSELWWVLLHPQPSQMVLEH